MWKTEQTPFEGRWRQSFRLKRTAKYRIYKGFGGCTESCAIRPDMASDRASLLFPGSFCTGFSTSSVDASRNGDSFLDEPQKIAGSVPAAPASSRPGPLPVEGRPAS